MFEKLVETLKTISVNRYSVEELLALRAGARMLWQEYEAQELDKPEWLNNSLISIDGQVRSMVRDERIRRLNAAKARRENLRTPEEKRADLDAEIARLQEMVG